MAGSDEIIVAVARGQRALGITASDDQSRRLAVAVANPSHGSMKRMCHLETKGAFAVVSMPKQDRSGA
jgi:hypothetical protein